MTVMWASYGPYGLAATVVVIVVTSLIRGWLVPARTVDTIRTQQQQITDLWRQTAEAEQRRADTQQEDLVTLMRELTEALRRSQPAAGI